VNGRRRDDDTLRDVSAHGAAAGQPGADGEGAPRGLSVYDAVGGMPFFDELVERFYRGVATDLLLRPLYPDDLSGPKRRLALFLAQYWGGPTTYSEERGHPRLRMRHAPFVIGEAERDAWMRHMAAALGSVVEEHDIHPSVEARLLDHFTMTADAMINTR
jgi:hemoglobin